MIEPRIKSPTKGVTVPQDFCKMVADVFSKNFATQLKKMPKEATFPTFDVIGTIFPKEIFLAICLSFKNQTTATTVYASLDFDPKATLPKAQDLLHLAVDAIGSVFEHMLETPEALAEPGLDKILGVPYEWAPHELEKRKVYLKVDKANLSLELAASKLLGED